MTTLAVTSPLLRATHFTLPRQHLPLILALATLAIVFWAGIGYSASTDPTQCVAYFVGTAGALFSMLAGFFVFVQRCLDRDSLSRERSLLTG